MKENINTFTPAIAKDPISDELIFPTVCMTVISSESGNSLQDLLNQQYRAFLGSDLLINRQITPLQTRIISLLQPTALDLLQISPYSHYALLKTVFTIC